jgi:uncharacterized protein DUF3352
MAIRRRQLRSTLRATTLALLLALTLAACGGDGGTSGGGKAPDTASFAPASAAFFVSVDTDFDGEQWQKASALLDKFPSRDKLVRQLKQELAQDDVDFERDIKPTVGPEVGIVGFGLSDDPPVVLYTKSPDPAKLKTLLAKGDEPMIAREVDGWTVAAETKAELDRFDRERGGNSLADTPDFQEALSSVDGDAGVVAYVAGSGIQRAFSRVLLDEGAPTGLAESLGELRAIALSASAEDDGVRFGVATTREKEFGLEGYKPALDETLPAKPIVFLSAANLDKLARRGLDTAADVVPNFSEQRAQIEKALGFSIENDVLPLLAKEVAFGVYGEATGGLPVTVDAVLTVEDEAKARQLMDRLGALLELGGSGKASKVQVGDVQATEVHFNDGGISIFWVVDDGRLEISTSREGLEKLRGSSPRLADDDAYTAALDAAQAPDEVAALVYSDLQTAVQFFGSLAGAEPDAETRANLKPLRSIVATETEDGGTLHVSGFLGIG